MAPTLTREQALKLLHLADDDLDAASVRLAFANRVKAVHPDTADIEQASGQAARALQELRASRDMLLDMIATKQNACRLCKGSGRVQASMGFRQCGACAGTGAKR